MESCLFCRIVKKEIPSRIVFEDEKAVVFQDVNPQAPVHMLVIPKIHRETLMDIREKEDDSLMVHLFSVIKRIVKEKELDKRGFRLVANTGVESGQTVFHLHFHLLAGRPMKWPPG